MGGGEGKNIYDDLKRDLRGFPVEDFVRAYAKAYFEADVDSLKRLRALLGEEYKETGHPDAASPDAPVRSPLQPRPNLNSGAVALPMPQPKNSDQ
jgi:hypothetical protein